MKKRAARSSSKSKKSDDKWMQEANKTMDKGALRRKARRAGAINSEGNIDKSWIEKQTHSKNKETRAQANLAQTFAKSRKSKRKK